MISLIQKIFNSLNKPKSYLLVGNFLLVTFLIIFTNLGFLPFHNFGDFIFFAIIGLALALYRPGWAFLFFIGTIALENVNVAPKGFWIDIRPYQFFGAMIILALAIRYFAGRLNFKLAKLHWFDYILIIFALAGFVSALFAIDKGLAFKQSIIITSFVFLYFLVRNYIQNLEDLKKIIPFFLSTSFIIIIYGIWQNVRFLHNLNSFELMPGRPNATFTEADWLGVFLVLFIATIYSLIYYYNRLSLWERSTPMYSLGREREDILINSYNQYTLHSLHYTFYIFLIPVYILLILTVSRSAWIGTGIITIIFLKIILTGAKFNPKYWQLKEFLKQAGFIILTGIISLLIVYIFHLTNFQLFNRAQSTGTGLQKITIACNITDCAQMDCVNQKILNPGSVINNVTELKDYDCRHINLEDIEKEKVEGKTVIEIYRRDPNVNIRAQIYQKSLAEIKKHPVLGIGWGSIGKILGTDERGTVLNSSNIFLEIWLGSGIVGLLAFLTILVYIFIKSLRGLFSDDFEKKVISTLIILLFFALIIPNLFNSGIFLGIMWLFLGISHIKKQSI